MSPRQVAALSAILLLSSAAHAGTAEELTAAITKCAAIADDTTRHACYDQLPTLLKSLPPVTAADTLPPAATQPTAPPPREETGSSTGHFSLFGDIPVPADHITTAVESFTLDYGLFVVTLSNGQVWRQTTATGDRVHFNRDKKDQVMIWRSPFGYDVLRVDGDPALYHVRRIK